MIKIEVLVRVGKVLEVFYDIKNRFWILILLLLLFIIIFRIY